MSFILRCWSSPGFIWLSLEFGLGCDKSEEEDEKLHVQDELAGQIQSELNDFGNRVKQELMEEKNRLGQLELIAEKREAVREDLERDDINAYDFDL